MITSFRPSLDLSTESLNNKKMKLFLRGWWLAFATIFALIILWGMKTPPRANPLFPLEPNEATIAELGSNFDTSTTGSISGRVTWSGAIPSIPSIEVPSSPYIPKGTQSRPNPFTPTISKANGLQGNVVFLKKVDLKKSRQWDHSPVVVEVTNLDISLKQDGKTERIAIVRAGDSIELISKEELLHSIRARGSAYFTQMLTTSNQPVKQLISKPGVVSLSSGSGFIWAQAYLIATEHPYVAITDREGNFELKNVPLGNYELVSLQPDWNINLKERDPEYIAHVRIHFTQPKEQVREIVVEPARNTLANFIWTANYFPKPAE